MNIARNALATGTPLGHVLSLCGQDYEALVTAATERAQTAKKQDKPRLKWQQAGPKAIARIHSLRSLGGKA